MKNTKKLSLILVLLIAQYTQAQYRITDNNTLFWTTATATVHLKNKWSLHLENQERRVDLLNTHQQNLSRAALLYSFNDKITFGLGYGFILTYPYGDHPIASNGRFSENRIFQQVQIKNSLTSKTESITRIRQEQRWVGKNDASHNFLEWVQSSRTRVLYRINYTPGLMQQKLYFSASDELFISYGKKVKLNVFDQNRLMGLVGYKFSKKLNVEAGVLSQIVQQGSAVNAQSVYQYNLGPIVNLVFKL